MDEEQDLLAGLRRFVAQLGGHSGHPRFSAPSAPAAHVDLDDVARWIVDPTAGAGTPEDDRTIGCAGCGLGLDPHAAYCPAGGGRRAVRLTQCDST